MLDHHHDDYKNVSVTVSKSSSAGLERFMEEVISADDGGNDYYGEINTIAAANENQSESMESEQFISLNHVVNEDTNFMAHLNAMMDMELCKFGVVNNHPTIAAAAPQWASYGLFPECD